MYIIVVSTQTPGWASIFVQFAETGKHCNKFAKKKPMVQATMMPIIVHEIMENALVVKILLLSLA